MPPAVPAPDFYVHSQGHPYQELMGVSCWPSMQVLQPIWGMPWNELTFAAVSAARPSKLRVVRPHQEEKTDSCLWRVNVYLDSENRIRTIEQEVEVRGFDGHGAAFLAAVRESPGWRTPCCGALWHRREDISDHPGTGTCTGCGSFVYR